MSASLSLIERQPAVHLGQIAKFLSLKDLARCQKTCPVFQERMIVPVTEKDVADGEITGLDALRTAGTVHRTVVQANLHLSTGSAHLLILNPMPQGISIRRLAIFTRQDHDQTFPPLIRATTQVRAIELNALTPLIADAVVESCPLLEEIKVSHFEIPAMDTIAERCTRLTNVSLEALRPFDRPRDLTSILSRLQSLQFLHINYTFAHTFPSELAAITSQLRSFRVNIGHTEADQLNFLATHPQLEEYCMSNITAAVLRALSPRIHTLHILHCLTLTDAELAAFTHPSLTSLLIRVRAISEPILAQIGTNLPQLRTLNLKTSSKFSFNQIRQLVMGFFPSLTNIDYDDSNNRGNSRSSPPGQTLAQMWSQS
jgi:hypothetical protein